MQHCGGGVTDREELERERKRMREKGRSGCNEQEASGMNSQRWPRMAGLNWPGSGRWRVGGGLRGSCTSSWTERERQKDDRARERERARERPPGADRCSPPLQLRPHS